MKLSTKNFTPQQQEATDYIYDRNHALLMCKMGFGKSVVTLTAANELLDDKVIRRVLIVAPLRVCDLVWATESDKWSHLKRKPAIATGPPLERLNAIKSTAEIVVINFENLPWFFKVFTTHNFDALVIDELTKLKSVSGAWFKALRNHITDFKWRVGLTGTLVEEGLDKVYSMAMVVDNGKALGRRKEAFMTKYFDPTDYMRYNWVPKEGAMETVGNLLRPFTFTAGSEDQKLPPLLQDYIHVDIPLDRYKELEKQMALELAEGTVEAANQAVLSNKLRQACSGFLYTEKATARLHDVKLRAIQKEILRSADPVMVCYQHTWEREELQHLFPDAKIMGAGVTRKEAIQITRDWNEGRLNVMLVHPASAGHGLNFQFGSNRLIFFGPLWSRDQHDQVISRLHRRGQVADHVRVTTIVARGTVEDAVIVPRLMNKGDMASGFRTYMASLV